MIAIVDFKLKVDWLVKLVFNVEVLDPFWVQVVINCFSFTDELPFFKRAASYMQLGEGISPTKIINIGKVCGLQKQLHPTLKRICILLALQRNNLI